MESNCCWEHWNEPRRFVVVEPPAPSSRLRPPRTIITVSDADDRLIEQTLVEDEDEEEEEQEQEQEQDQDQNIRGLEEDEEVTAIDEDRLEYRAEGNANIVMAVRGTRYVLRLRKSDVASSEGKDSPIDLVRFIKYTRVMASLFSEHFVPELKLGRVETYDLDAFNKKLIKLRPVTRLDKEIRVRDGILYPDVAFLPAKLCPAAAQHSAAFVRRSCCSDYGQEAPPHAARHQRPHRGTPEQL